MPVGPTSIAFPSHTDAKLASAKARRYIGKEKRSMPFAITVLHSALERIRTDYGSSSVVGLSTQRVVAPDVLSDRAGHDQFEA
jgi:hypothetical protein